MTKDKRFLIVGLGMMGGSYAMGLSRQGYKVFAIDSDPDAIRYAKENSLIAQGGGPEETEALLATADYIILALYPDVILPWLRQNRGFFKPGAMLTDLVGVKSNFVPEAQELLAPWHEFIPSHPMAGREVSGVQNADDGIFHGANFLITPTKKNTPTGLEFAHKLAGALGFGRVTELTLAQHDSIIAYVSQLTHAIAVSLMNANGDPLLPDVTGDSFRDLTRIANINEELWSELFLANAPALIEQIDLFAATLQNLRENLAIGNGEALKTLFHESRQRRLDFSRREEG